MHSPLTVPVSSTTNTSLKAWSIDQGVLLDRLRRHDKAAFACLYKQYSAAIYGSLLNKLNDQDAANRILEETFICVWNDISTYDESKMRLFTWLNQICAKLVKEIQ